MSDSLKTIDELQKQIWDCVKLNSDNPLGYTLLDAHFARIKRIMAAERLDELNRITLKGNYREASGMYMNIDDRIAQLEQLIAAGEDEG